MRPGVALLLWLSTMVLIIANSAIGNTLMASASPRVADLYNTIVPLPYIALCAWILARRSPHAAMSDAILVGLLWASSTIIVDIASARLLQGLSWRLAVVHLRFWDGYLFALVPFTQLIAPAGALALRRRVFRARS